MIKYLILLFIKMGLFLTKISYIFIKKLSKFIYKNTPFLKIWNKILENFGIVFGFISLTTLSLALTAIANTPNLVVLSSVIPLITFCAFFGLKAVGFYRLDILEDNRRDLKKALIALTAIQVFMTYGFISVLVCTLSIPLAILEWYPRKSHNYITQHTDRTKTIKVLLQS